MSSKDKDELDVLADIAGRRVTLGLPLRENRLEDIVRYQAVNLVRVFLEEVSTAKIPSLVLVSC